MRAIVYDIKPAGWAACRLLRPVWRSWATSRLNGLSLRDLPAPELPGDDWVRLRTLMAGICGTDLAILAQKQRPDSILQAYSSMPMLFGHENVAIVEDLGPAVDAAWKGKRVCVEPTLGCVARGIEPPCPRCREGHFGSCENFAAAGAGRYGLPAGTSVGYNSRTGGSYGERFTAHVSQLVSVPHGLTDEQAILTDPLACSLHSALRADWQRARQVLVYGSGILGLGIVACLRAVGYAGRIDFVGRHSFQDDLARRLGATGILRLGRSRPERFDTVARATGGQVKSVRFGNLMLSGGYDIIFDCVGSGQSVQESLKWTAARGQVVMVGTGHGGGADLTPIWFRELSVIGAYGRQEEQYAGQKIGTYQLVHRLMSERKLVTDGLLTHTFAIGDYREAFAVAMDKSRHKSVKVAFDLRPGRST